jgi:CRISPR/Cas system-associated endonuclease Cas1
VCVENAAKWVRDYEQNIDNVCSINYRKMGSVRKEVSQRIMSECLKHQIDIHFFNEATQIMKPEHKNISDTKSTIIGFV